MTMRVITTPEIALLAKELKEFIGFYIDRFYEVAEDRFRIKLSRRGAQTANLQIILSHTVNKTGYIEKQEHASNFALAVRKRIEGFVIGDISQYNEDRILLMRLKKGENETNMIIEMFGKGNMILADADMAILLAYKVHDFKDRKIRPGERYIPPKKGFAKETPAQEAKPTVYRKEGRAVDYSLVGEEMAGTERQEFKTLQEALDIFYYENPIIEKRESTAKERQMEELTLSIAKQEEGLASVDREIEANKEKGALLLARIHEINLLVRAMQANKRLTKDELQKMFPKIKVLNVDLKEKTVKIEAEKP